MDSSTCSSSSPSCKKRNRQIQDTPSGNFSSMTRFCMPPVNLVVSTVHINGFEARARFLLRTSGFCSDFTRMLSAVLRIKVKLAVLSTFLIRCVCFSSSSHFWKDAQWSVGFVMAACKFSDLEYPVLVS